MRKIILPTLILGICIALPICFVQFENRATLATESSPAQAQQVDKKPPLGNLLPAPQGNSKNIPVHNKSLPQTIHSFSKLAQTPTTNKDVNDAANSMTNISLVNNASKITGKMISPEKVDLESDYGTISISWEKIGGIKFLKNVANSSFQKSTAFSNGNLRCLSLQYSTDRPRMPLHFWEG